MIQLLHKTLFMVLMLATGAHALARYAVFFNDDQCSDTDRPREESGFRMNNGGCFSVGHKLSYTTGNTARLAPGGKWCLIKYEGDACIDISDYEVIEVGKDDRMCHTLEPNPYHGAYQWYKIGDNGKCPVSGSYPNNVNYQTPDYEKKTGKGWMMRDEVDQRQPLPMVR